MVPPPSICIPIVYLYFLDHVSRILVSYLLSFEILIETQPTASESSLLVRSNNKSIFSLTLLIHGNSTVIKLVSVKTFF